MPRRRVRRARGPTRNPTLCFEFAVSRSITWSNGVSSPAWEPTFGQFAIDSSRPLRVVSVRLEVRAAHAQVVALSASLFGAPTPAQTSAIVDRSSVVLATLSRAVIRLRLPPQTDYQTVASNSPVFRLQNGPIQDGTTNVSQVGQLVVAGELRVQYRRRDEPVYFK